MSGEPGDDATDAVVQVLRRARPDEAVSGALERRLAVSAILSAANNDAERPRLGRLEVQSRLGGGAMGVVYRAYDPELERRVAVKVLRGHAGRDERLRVVDEARKLARVSHPNVVAIYDIVDDSDGLYFTMEYVPGLTLGAWLDAHPAAQAREVLEWFVQAGRGLAAAHAQGLVHRDFKPANVLVGNDGRVRVVDFGLARGPRDADAPAAGTPYFMAPELLQAQGSASPASDQYAFARALCDALQSREPPAHVRGAIERALDADPERRHGSLDALLEILEGSLSLPADGRPRALLLDRVESMWLSGVLDRSLGNASAAELTLSNTPELVEPPWQSWSASRSQRPLALEPAEPQPRTHSRALGQRLRDSHGSLLLVGPPGAGKTTLLLQLCRELWRTATVQPDAPAPVVLSLSTYRPATNGAPRGATNGKGPDELHAHFHAWVLDELVVKYGLPRPAVRRWFDDAALVLLLDGLDETDPELRTEVVHTLNRFRAECPLSMVVTCRDSEYGVLQQRLAFGGAARVEPLDDAGLTTVLEERRAQGLLDELTRDGELRELLRNPLLLTLYADAATTTGTAGEKASLDHAYARYVEHALHGLDARTRTQWIERMAFLARCMQRTHTSDLWLERLSFDWLPSAALARVGYLLGALLVAAFSVGLNVAQVPLTQYPLASALVFGVGVFVCSFAYTRGRITPVESLRWSAQRALGLLPVTMVCALGIGVIEGLKVNFVANMVGAAITGAIMGLLFALEPSERATRMRPNAGIHQSLVNALATSFGAGVPVGLFFGFVVQPHITHPLAVNAAEYTGNPPLIVGVSVGLFVFTAMLLIYGGFTVLMHYALRLWLSLCTPLPLRLVPMLNTAADLGLLRRVGGGYVFLHRTLLDHFANAK